MSLPHFENAIRCRNKAHDHGLGYSCAIDSFLEVYHYGIFYQETILHAVDQPFIQQLNETSRTRHLTQCASCDMREAVWNLLVQKEYAFKPKGTVNASIDAAFEMLVSSAPGLFSPVIQGVSHCYTCQRNTPVTSNLALMHFLYSLRVSVDGHLLTGIELQIQRQLTNQAVCQTCKFKTFIDGVVCMPHFLFVDLCLYGEKNAAISVAQQILIHGIQYELTAAIVKEPQHFLSIVKYGAGFALINDLSSHVEYFSTFASAVSRNRHKTMQSHVLTPDDRAVTILIYHRIASENVVPFRQVLRPG